MSFQGNDRFEVRRCLGSGGFGTVYEAFDRRRGALVAVKVLKQADGAQIYRFKQEFRALRGIVHPNLITLDELISDGDPWLFSMELIEGADFLRFLTSQPVTDASFTLPTPEGSDSQTVVTGVVATHTEQDLQRPGAASASLLPAPVPSAILSIPLERLIEAMRQLTQGLMALHQAGKIHLDIKPANVLCTQAGRVVILDFGIARDLAPESDTAHELAGTPVYMAPEQAQARPLTPAADWYSVGALLYQALTGRPPFTGPALYVLCKKQSEDPPPPSSLRGDIPPALDALCVRLLSREPGARPGGEEILAILQELASEVVSPPSPPSLPPREAPFVGREPHLAQLFEAHEESQRGGAVVVLCRGPSGAGKSTLCRRFIELSSQRDPRAVALTGRCFENEEVPFKALDGVVDDLVRLLRQLGPEAARLLPPDTGALTRLFPVLLRVPAVEERPSRAAPESTSTGARAAASQALRGLMQRLAARQPLLLFVDDLQWGDLDSVSLLFDLLSPPDPPPLLLLLGYRSDEERTSAPLIALRRRLRGELGRGVRVVELEVGELTEGEAQTLARTLLPEGERGRAEAIAREAGRNAMFVAELSRAPELPGGLTLEDALQARVDRLDPASRRLLSVVAVAGQPVPRAIASSAVFSGQERGNEPRALAILRGGRLLRVRHTSARRRHEAHHEELHTYHDRIRQTLLRALPAEEISGLHLALAGAFQESDCDEPERLAFHLLRGGRPHEAARYTVQASAQAEQALAYHRTASLCQVALETGALSPADELSIRVRLADALAGAGRPREAAEAYLGLASRDPERRQRWWQQAARLYFIGGYIDSGMQALDRLAREARLRIPRSEAGLLAMGLMYWGLLAARGVDFRPRAEAEIPGDELLRVDTCEILCHATSEASLALCFSLAGLWFALRAGEPRRVAHALATAIPVLFVLGASRARLDVLIARARELAEANRDELAQAKLAYALGHTAHFEGRWRASSGHLQEARKITESSSFEAASRRSFILTLHAYNLRWMGDLNAIAAEVPPLLREAEEQEHQRQRQVVPCTAGFLLALREDDPARAEEQLMAILREARATRPSIVLFFATDALLRTALYRGQSDEAARWLAQQRPAIEASIVLRLEFFRLAWAELEGLVAITSGQPARLVERHLRALERSRVGFGPPLGASLRALLARREGRRGEALALAARAEAGFAALDMRMHEASALLSRGRWLGGADGERLGQRALGWFREQGVKAPERMARMFLPEPAR